MSEESVRGWMDSNGSGGPSAANLIAISEALGVSPFNFYDVVD